MKEYLKLNKIKKSFGETPVLDGIDFTINKNEIVSIIGPSGSGKTTLLRIIARLEKIDAGEITFAKKPKVGMVFQDFNLWPHKTVLENIITAPMLVKKIAKEEAVKEAKEILEKVGLENKAESYPFQLSGGEKQRAAIARALAMKPELLLFDEITSNLDPEMIGDVNKVIRKLAEDGFTLVFVSHDIFFAEEISDKIFFIDKGKIVESGSASNVLLNPTKKRTKQFLARTLNK